MAVAPVRDCFVATPTRMNIETLRIPVGDLVKGMHVVKLDRPWLETPFELQGFRIERSRELQLLRQYCKYVYVDVARGVHPPRGLGVKVIIDERGEIVGSQGNLKPDRAAPPQDRSPERSELPAPAVTYELEAGFDEELPRAMASVNAARQAVRALISAIRSGTSRERLAPVRAAAVALEQSVLRNPDPAMLIRALRSEETFSFRHCVDSAILAITLCRAMGFRRQAIHELTMGVLLADIGKSRLPSGLLGSRERLTAQQTAVVQQHVPLGVAMAQELDGLAPATVEVIAAHHERFNGSGYPAGLRGGEISLNARVAGLVDAFDAITSERAYSQPIPIYEAIQEMYAATIDVFQRELVERLIQVLGTYPVGSLVELSDGAVAVVVAQNTGRKLLPRVIVLADAAGKLLRKPVAADLADDSGDGRRVNAIVDSAACRVPPPDFSILLA